MLRQSQHELNVNTRGRGFYELTREVSALVQRSAIKTGLVTLHLLHTSASLLILYLWEHRTHPHSRRLIVHLLGE